MGLFTHHFISKSKTAQPWSKPPPCTVTEAQITLTSCGHGFQVQHGYSPMTYIKLYAALPSIYMHTL